MRFVGREELIGEIERRILAGNSTILTGGPGLGKSTIVDHLQGRLNGDARFRNLEIQRVPSAADSGERSLSSAVLRALGSAPGSSPGLAEILAQGRPRVVLIDDMDRFVAGRSIGAEFAVLAPHVRKGSLRLVATSRKPLARGLGLGVALFERCLGPLSREDAEAMVRSLVPPDKGLDPGKIVEYVGPHPLLLGIVCARLLDLALARKVAPERLARWSEEPRIKSEIDDEILTALAPMCQGLDERESDDLRRLVWEGGEGLGPEASERLLQAGLAHRLGENEIQPINDRLEHPDLVPNPPPAPLRETRPLPAHALAASLVLAALTAGSLLFGLATGARAWQPLPRFEDGLRHHAPRATKGGGSIRLKRTDIDITASLDAAAGSRGRFEVRAEYEYDVLAGERTPVAIEFPLPEGAGIFDGVDLRAPDGVVAYSMKKVVWTGDLTKARSALYHLTFRTPPSDSYCYLPDPQERPEELAVDIALHGTGRGQLVATGPEPPDAQEGRPGEEKVLLVWKLEKIVAESPIGVRLSATPTPPPAALGKCLPALLLPISLLMLWRPARARFVLEALAVLLVALVYFALLTHLGETLGPLPAWIAVMAVTAPVAVPYGRFLLEAEGTGSGGFEPAALVPLGVLGAVGLLSLLVSRLMG